MPTTSATLDHELAARLRLAVMRLARRLRQQADSGITPSMLSALSSVERLGPITFSELARAERIQPPSLTKIVARLEEEGLVVRTVDEHDRRIARLSLSDKGTRLINTNRSRKNAYLAQRLRKLPPADVEAIEKAVAALEHLLEGRD